MENMNGSMQSSDMAPLVKGFYEGHEMHFIHTEVSDQGVADMLTMMMGPQVVLVPQLAEAADSLLANVYVFTNGVEGSGPFGFQPDVFDAVPGQETYRPLRAIQLVTWELPDSAEELRSVKELNDAEQKGSLSIERSGIVVNMPILTWPGGQR